MGMRSLCVQCTAAACDLSTIMLCASTCASVLVWLPLPCHGHAQSLCSALQLSVALMAFCCVHVHVQLCSSGCPCPVIACAVSVQRTALRLPLALAALCCVHAHVQLSWLPAAAL